MLAKFGATIVGCIILGLPVFTGRVDKYLTKNKEHNAAIITKNYVQNQSLLINLAKAIGRIIVSYKDLQNLAGYTHLVSELKETIDEINEGKYIRKQINEDIAKKYTGGSFEVADFIEFEDVPIITPNGEALMENINFKVSFKLF